MTTYINNSRTPDEKEPVYLVWTINMSGIVSIRAVSLNRTTANKYRKEILEHDAHRVLRCWIERRDLEHLYGYEDVLHADRMGINRKELHDLARSLPLDDTIRSRKKRKEATK